MAGRPLAPAEANLFVSRKENDSGILFLSPEKIAARTPTRRKQTHRQIAGILDRRI